MNPQHIAILGYGREGRSTLAYLLARGVSPEDITLLDAKSLTDVPSGVAVRTGEEYLDELDAFDRIYKTSGIATAKHPELLRLRDRLTSQTQEFFEWYRGRVIVVSGTKGKSTTASLIVHILRYDGQRILLVGNIGTPVLSEVDFDHEYDAIVYEMSSYMLADNTFSCFAGVLVNIYPDHLDWHGGFEAYRDAKLSLLSRAEHIYIGSEVLTHGYVRRRSDGRIERPDGYIFPAKSATLYGYSGETVYQDRKFVRGDTTLFSDANISLLGDHNRYNIAGAISVCLDRGVSSECIAEAIACFSPLPHRLEYVGEYGGIYWYDDAISTTPESTIAGLRTFGGRVRTIFLGGEDRGYDFEALVDILGREGVKNIILFPDSGIRICEILPKDRFTVFETRSMREAVDFAYRTTPPETIALLSCASPSYSLWKDFEEKGRIFQQEIRTFLPSTA